MIQIYKVDESSLFIKCDYDEAVNISEYFEFYAPNYMFSPKYKMGWWDGKIRLFDIKTCRLPIGLFKSLCRKLSQNNYEFTIKSPELLEYGKKISNKNVLGFSKNILKVRKITPYDYQVRAVQYALYLQKCIIQSSTASGKSFIAFLIFNLLKYMNENFKFLLVVPTVQLVKQMRSDFNEYAENLADYDEYIHMIYAGQEKHTEKPITISTWQSLQKLDKTYFHQFDCILIDEVHKASGVELQKIIQNSIKAKYKIGLTGTIRKAKTDVMQLEALFGNIKRVSKTKQLMKDGKLTPLRIHGILLNYSKRIAKATKKFTYEEEVKFVYSIKKRIHYICRLANSTKGNTLILFRKRDYGNAIFEELKNVTKKEMFYVDGTIDVNKREEYTKFCEEHDNVVMVCSYGTFSTGVNIKNLPNIIFGESMKSMIIVLQSIGRGLRLHKNKKITTLYDIVDNMKYGRHKNYLLNHFFERVGYYDEEEFDYNIKEINFLK